MRPSPTSRMIVSKLVSDEQPAPFAELSPAQLWQLIQRAQVEEMDVVRALPRPDDRDPASWAHANEVIRRSYGKRVVLWQLLANALTELGSPVDADGLGLPRWVADDAIGIARSNWRLWGHFIIEDL